MEESYLMAFLIESDELAVPRTVEIVNVLPSRTNPTQRIPNRLIVIVAGMISKLVSTDAQMKVD